MKRALAILVVFSAACPAAQNVLLYGGSDQQQSLHQVTVSSQSRTSLEFALSGLVLEDVSFDGINYTRIRPLDSDFATAGELALDGQPELPAYTNLVIVPDQAKVSARIISSEHVTYENVLVAPTQPSAEEGKEDEIPFTIDEGTYSRNAFFPEQIVVVGEPAIMRDFRFVSATVHPVQYNPVTRQMRVYTRINYELVYEGTDNKNVKIRTSNEISEAFLPIYRAVFANAEQVLVDYSPRRGGYLIIYPNNTNFPADTLALLARWKHLKGFAVTMIRGDQIPGGPTVTNIKNYIQNAYYTWPVKPEYLLIVGDVDVTNAIPDHHYTSYYSDHGYTELEGSDYIPDIFVARMSVDGLTDFRSALHKVLQYESDPYVGETAYWLRALGVAGNCCGTPTPTTPRITVLWVRDLLLEHGYTQVDTVFQWQGQSCPNCSTMINNSLNLGISYVFYRGYATPSGWAYPSYHVQGLGMQTASRRLGIMTSIVCGTGNFGSSTDPCFGEAWIRGGSPPSTFRGGPCFFGPTDGSTHTRWNNPIMVGFYYGLFYVDCYRFAQNVLMGKMRMYMTFPHFHATGSTVQLYFNTYSGLGDPELEMRTTIPKNMTATYPASIPTGQNFLTVQVTGQAGLPLAGAYVNLVKGYAPNEEIFVGGTTDSAGMITLNFRNTIPDTIFVTVTARDYIPHRGYCLSVSQSVALGADTTIIDDDDIGGTDGNSDGKANPHETLGLNIRLRNYGTSVTATSVSANLVSLDSRASVIAGTQSYPNIAPGGTALPTGQFRVSLAADIAHQDRIPLRLDVTSAQGNWQTWVVLEINSIRPVSIVASYPGNPNNRLDPGETSNIVISFENAGTLAGENITGILRCSDRYISISDSIGTFGNIGIGQTGNNNSDPFVVVVNDTAYPGRNVNLVAFFTANMTTMQNVQFIKTFSITIGQPLSTDPVGPDMYGYYMYDNTDLLYSPAPVYQWIEINPNRGGSGGTALNFLPNNDDGSTLITLPFPVKYYGRTYGHMTVSTNGFAAFDTVPYDQAGNYWFNWANWPIPDPGNARAQISPFWDDLKVQNTGSGVYTRYDAAEGRFIIEWSDMTHANTGSPETFQMIIFEATTHPTPTGDNEIVFQYNVINNDDYNPSATEPETYSSVGFEDWEELDGLQYEYDDIYHPAAAPLVSGRAIKITTAVGLAPQPVLSYEPAAISTWGVAGESTQTDLIIANDGDGMLYYSIEPEETGLRRDAIPLGVSDSGNRAAVAKARHSGKDTSPGNPVTTGRGGPDAFGYVWRDSHDPHGPTYNWVDITSIGTPINFTTGSLDEGMALNLPIGFSFPFYGDTFTTLNVCTNGYVTFGSTSIVYNNTTIPNTAGPNNLLAAYWDDLNFAPRGNAYIYRNNIDSCVIAFVNVPHYQDDGAFTFEIILLDSGKIVYQYQLATGPDTNQMTIGIENGTGTVGLQVAYNVPYVRPPLAVAFFIPPPPWVSADPPFGTVAPHSRDTVTITCSAARLAPGLHHTVLLLTSNWRPNPEIQIPVSFQVYPAPGYIKGVVKKLDNTTPLAGVIVSTYDSGQVLMATDTTDVNGRYLVTLPPGNYAEQFRKSGYRDTTLGGISVAGAETTHVVMLLAELATCEYVPGDINSDGEVRGSDITYGVRYFKGLGAPPPDSCYHDSIPGNHWLYVAGDVNGNCEFRGSDLTKLVAYLKGTTTISSCPLFPPPAIMRIGSPTGLPIETKDLSPQQQVIPVPRRNSR